MTAREAFVPTGAIQRGVVGRETEIFLRLTFAGPANPTIFTALTPTTPMSILHGVGTLQSAVHSAPARHPTQSLTLSQR